MIYQLVNPSDPWTFEAASDKIAWIVSLHVGRGKTPAKRDDWQAPLYFMGGDPENDFQAEFGEPFAGTILRYAGELIAALRSFMITREPKMKRLEGEELAKWNDERRSSMNDFGAEANRIADAIEKKLAGLQKA